MYEIKLKKTLMSKIGIFNWFDNMIRAIKGVAIVQWLSGRDLMHKATIRIPHRDSWLNLT